MKLKLLFQILFTLALLPSATWAGLALHYQLPLSPLLRTGAIVLWGLLAIAALVLAWRGQPGGSAGLYGLALGALLFWWSGLQPSNQRDWASDVARHLQPTVKGSQVTLGQVRNFDWRSDHDYTVRWEPRSYNLDQLRSVDMGLSYWMGPAIAHTLVSFGFDNGQGGTEYLSFSIEIRKERHESFSALAGFFKRFELSLVAADERDMLRVRTNVRGEDVYLYRVQMAPAAMRSLFLAYVDEAESLQRQPRFYNTLTTNCTTIVYQMVQRIVGGLPADWRLLASGYLPEYVHEVGGLTPGLPLEQLRAAGRITLRAQAADASPDFSQAIRQGIPGMTTP